MPSTILRYLTGKILFKPSCLVWFFEVDFIPIFS